MANIEMIPPHGVNLISLLSNSGSQFEIFEKEKRRKSCREEGMVISGVLFLSNFKQQKVSYNESSVVHYLMGIVPNPKKSTRIAESRFGYLKVCSSV